MAYDYSPQAPTGSTDGSARGEQRGEETGQLARLSELDDYYVADGEPDVRRWKVKTADGRDAGKVEGLIVDLGALRVSYLEVKLDRRALRLGHSRNILIPIEAAWLDEDQQIVNLALTAVELIAAPAYDPRSFSARDHDMLQRRYAERLTRSEEELDVHKRKRLAGEVHVRKRVETEHVEKAVPVTREQVVVERRPSRSADSETKIEDDQVVVPVMEEEVVAEKRAVPKEEVVIRKQRVRDEKTVSADLKKERIDVDRR